MFDELLAGQPEALSWVFIIGGALLALLGVFKIIGKGISFFIWVVLIVVGVSAVHMGLKNQSAVQLSPEISARLEGILEPGAQLSQEAIASLCERLTSGDAPDMENASAPMGY